MLSELSSICSFFMISAFFLALSARFRSASYSLFFRNLYHCSCHVSQSCRYKSPSSFSSIQRCEMRLSTISILSSPSLNPFEKTASATSLLSQLRSFPVWSALFSPHNHRETRIPRASFCEHPISFANSRSFPPTTWSCTLIHANTITTFLMAAEMFPPPFRTTHFLILHLQNSFLPEPHFSYPLRFHFSEQPLLPQTVLLSCS